MSRGGDLRDWARNLETEAKAASGLYNQAPAIVDDADPAARFFQRVSADCQRRLARIQRAQQLLPIRYGIAVLAGLLFLLMSYIAGRGGI